MKCPNCNEEFSPRAVNQIYCSTRCGDQYRRKHGAHKRISITFNCSNCGRTVVTEPENGDKRTRFCSESCEKKYWKHPPCDYPSTFKNFRSVDEMLGYEKWANEANY